LRSARKADRSDLFGEFHGLAQCEKRDVVVERSRVEAAMPHHSLHASLDVTNLGVRVNVVITEAYRQPRHVPGVHTGTQYRAFFHQDIKHVILQCDTLPKVSSEL